MITKQQLREKGLYPGMRCISPYGSKFKMPKFKHLSTNLCGSTYSPKGGYVVYSESLANDRWATPNETLLAYVKRMANKKGVVPGTKVRTDLHGEFTVPPEHEWQQMSANALWGSANYGVFCAVKENSSGVWLFHHKLGWAKPVVSKKETKAPQHTPGPWRYSPGSNTIRSAKENYWIASIDSWDGQVNNQANAKLIAAAPELLEALRTMIHAYSGQLTNAGDYGKEIEAGCLAIARATSMSREAKKVCTQ